MSRGSPRLLLRGDKDSSREQSRSPLSIKNFRVNARRYNFQDMQ